MGCGISSTDTANTGVGEGSVRPPAETLLPVISSTSPSRLVVRGIELPQHRATLTPVDHEPSLHRRSGAAETTEFDTILQSIAVGSESDKTHGHRSSTQADNNWWKGQGLALNAFSLKGSSAGSNSERRTDHSESIINIVPDRRSGSCVSPVGGCDVTDLLAQSGHETICGSLDKLSTDNVAASLTSTSTAAGQQPFDVMLLSKSLPEAPHTGIHEDPLKERSLRSGNGTARAPEPLHTTGLRHYSPAESVLHRSTGEVEVAIEAVVDAAPIATVFGVSSAQPNGSVPSFDLRAQIIAAEYEALEETRCPSVGGRSTDEKPADFWLRYLRENSRGAWEARCLREVQREELRASNDELVRRQVALMALRNVVQAQVTPSAYWAIRNPLSSSMGWPLLPAEMSFARRSAVVAWIDETVRHRSQALSLPRKEDRRLWPMTFSIPVGQ